METLVESSRSMLWLYAIVGVVFMWAAIYSLIMALAPTLRSRRRKQCSP